MRKRRARRRAVGTRAPTLFEAKPNARWSLDFVHDQFACGRRFRVLNIVDDVTRECGSRIMPLLPVISLSLWPYSTSPASTRDRSPRSVVCLRYAKVPQAIAISSR